MSDHIAHIGICDDSFRLGMLHPKITSTFKQLMLERRDDAHMGCVTRHADKWSANVIAHARDAMSGQNDDTLAERKLAFVLGSLTHRAADRLTKPITNCWKGEPDSGNFGSAANESKIMQDIFVWKEVFQSGHGDAADPFSPWALAAPSEEPAALSEAWFRLMLRRALISMHTINPDDDNIHPWFERFFHGLQTFPKQIEQYAQLASKWPQDKVKKYLIDKHYYHRDDPTIALARSIHRGHTATEQQVLDAHQATLETHSRYARALAKALDYLIAGSLLFENKINVEDASKHLDIGVPELSLG